MNSTEDVRDLQNSSALLRSVQQDTEDLTDLQSTSKRAGGIGRGKKYPGADIPNQDFGRDDFLIMEQAYEIFERQGERRSYRMIAEYCKTGELVCTYDTDDKRWHITHESVKQKITKIKALNARKAAVVPQHTSENFSERPEAPQRPTEESRSDKETIPPSPEADKKIADLEQEVFDLKVLNKSKDMYIAQLVDDREKLLTRVETTSSLVGTLKQKLLQLVAPEKARDVDVLAAPLDMIPDPLVAKGSPNEPLQDNLNTHAYSSQA